MNEKQKQTKRDFMQSMNEVYGLSKAYAVAAWLSVQNSNMSDGVSLARTYCQRFGIAPAEKQGNLF